ncbi:MAG: DNA primase [Lentisphaeria bacterium]|nr:DNA primase [Lentisphaeria bacterium]
MARFIPDEVLETIRIRADITDVVQSYVPTLKKMGATWKACCPFHQEKTPSFTVNPERGIYKCFGCGKGGNVFRFIMDMERLDFPNAAEFLARKYNVIIPEEPSVRRWHPGQKMEAPEASYNVRERLYQLHEKLAAWYAAQLFQQPESAVAKYFATRLIPKEIAVQFQIGASPDAWDGAIQYLRGQGFTDEELNLSGVVSKKEETSEHFYDRFRNRLMFPICNEQGRVIAFSARSVEADPQGWKYVNSPENPVFRKSRTLYALHFARKGIAEKGCAVLCEGQLDVIAMHRAGCTHAVAPQGTAFGEEQAQILSRYTQKICLALDNDEAGRKAVFKDATILLPKGFQLKVAVFPGAKDADELLKKSGADVLYNAVEQAEDFFAFALRTVSDGQDLTSPAGKAAVASKIAEFLFLIDNPMTLDLYAAWLAEQLAISKESVLGEVTRHRQAIEAREARNARYAALAPVPDAAYAESQNAPPVSQPQEELPYSMRHPGVKKAFLELLDVLLNSEHYAGCASNDFTAEMFDRSPAGQALEILVQCSMNGEWEDAPSQIMMMLTKEGVDDPEITAMLAGKEETAEVAAPKDDPKQKQFQEKVYRSCLKVITRSSMQERRSQLIREAATLPDGSERKKEILQEVTAITREIFQRRT